MTKLPDGIGYDEEMKLFISNMSSHELYRRGRSVQRQDKISACSFLVVEKSEEIRLMIIKCIKCLIENIVSCNAQSILHPYFNDIILFLQYQLRDTFVDVIHQTCLVLMNLSLQDDLVHGMMYFAVAIARALLPNFCHRKSIVRACTIDTFRSIVMMPDLAKNKGAASEVIIELVGFTEENVLPVASFYKPIVHINYMANVVSDTSISVRRNLVKMLTSFLCDMYDRSDYETRLLPYVLDILTDENDEIASAAFLCLEKCGELYEREHCDEIIDRSFK